MTTSPPHDPFAEQATLGILLCGGLSLDNAPELQIDHFFIGKHRAIFQAIETLHVAGNPVNTVDVTSELRGAGRDQQTGAPGYLAELVNAVPAVNAKQLGSLVKTLQNRRVARGLLDVARKTIATIEAGIGDPAPALADAEAEIHRLSMGTRADTLVTMKDAIAATIKRMMDDAKVRADGSGASGVSTGFLALDKQTGGLHAGDLTVIAARPGMGKSALVMNVLVNAAKAGVGSCIFSLEMGREQLALRTICAEAGVSLSKARLRDLNHNDWSRLTTASVETCKLAPIWIDDSGSTRLADIRARARRCQAECKRAGSRLGVLAVDYLQLVNNTADNREQAIAEVSRTLKALAKDLGVAVIALSQLNRSVESRSDKRPMLGDLRESGAIEQDADNVVMLYRDDYYNNGSAEPGVCEAIIAKQRNGPTGVVKLKFDAPTASFWNMEDPYAV